MDVNGMLTQLREERQQVDEAILALERLASGRGKRRGRPPAWLAEMRKEGKQTPPAKESKSKKKDGTAGTGPVALAKSA